MTLLERLLRLEKLTKNLNKRLCCLQAGIQFQDEGVDSGSPGDITTINFTGDITTTLVGGVLTVNVAPAAATRFGFPGEDDIGGEARLFTSAFPVTISTPEFTIEDALGRGLFINFANLTYVLGDLDGVDSGTRLSINSLTQIAGIRNTNGHGLFIDFLSATYSLGDVDAVGNGTKIEVHDANQLTTISDTIGLGLSIDFANTRYQFGDIDTANNGLHIDLDDGGQSTEIADNDGQMFLLNRGLGLYQMGDIGAALNNSFIRIDDTNQIADILINGNRYLNFTLNEQRIGSVDGQGNQTEILIDDGNMEFQVNAANGIRINGDTILLHSTVALADGTGVATGTLTNAPTAGNPTKWISIEDTLGVIRYIPTWL